MAFDAKARTFTLSWEGGYLTATAGLLEFLYGPGFMGKVGAGAAQSITVKTHPRQRIIGGPTKQVDAYGYNLIKYPRRVKGAASGGVPIQIEADGAFWAARLGGSIQDFKTFLAGTGKPLQAFQFVSERGGTYSSAS
jgi:hypothetical protein